MAFYSNRVGYEAPVTGSKRKRRGQPRPFAPTGGGQVGVFAGTGSGIDR